MSKAQQFQFNFRCLIRDIKQGKWEKIAFHFAGIKRAIKQN